MAVMTAPQQRESIVSRGQQRLDLWAIQAAIQDALSRTGYGELRRVELQCDGDSVTISGRVPTYYLKQLAQNVALDVPGVEHVCNELHVC